MAGRSGTLTVQGIACVGAPAGDGHSPAAASGAFIALQGIDRAVVLASQAFTALIPLLLLVSALAPAGDRDVVSDGIIRRFRLTGDAADAVRQLFAHPGGSATGVFSVFLLVFSGRVADPADAADVPAGVAAGGHQPASGGRSTPRSG